MSWPGPTGLLPSKRQQMPCLQMLLRHAGCHQLVSPVLLTPLCRLKAGPLRARSVLEVPSFAYDHEQLMQAASVSWPYCMHCHPNPTRSGATECGLKERASLCTEACMSAVAALLLSFAVHQCHLAPPSAWRLGLADNACTAARRETVPTSLHACSALSPLDPTTAFCWQPDQGQT